MKEFTVANGKKIYYEKLDFQKRGLLPINRKIMKENLLRMKKIFDKNSFFYGLIFGTLLGAIRDKNLIKHDYDADIYIMYEDREKFFLLLSQFEKKGFRLIRDNKNIISLIRGDNYIDFYLLKKEVIGGKLYRSGPQEVFSVPHKSELFEEVIKFDFLGEKFNIPKQYIKILVLFYGKSWKIPRKYCSAKYNRTSLSAFLTSIFPHKEYHQFKQFVKNILRT